MPAHDSYRNTDAEKGDVFEFLSRSRKVQQYRAMMEGYDNSIVLKYGAKDFAIGLFSFGAWAQEIVLPTGNTARIMI